MKKVGLKALEMAYLKYSQGGIKCRKIVSFWTIFSVINKAAHADLYQSL